MSPDADPDVVLDCVPQSDIAQVVVIFPYLFYIVKRHSSYMRIVDISNTKEERQKSTFFHVKVYSTLLSQKALIHYIVPLLASNHTKLNTGYIFFIFILTFALLTTAPQTLIGD